MSIDVEDVNEEPASTKWLNLSTTLSGEAFQGILDVTEENTHSLLDKMGLVANCGSILHCTMLFILITASSDKSVTGRPTLFLQSQSLGALQCNGVYLRSRIQQRSRCLQNLNYQ